MAKIKLTSFITAANGRIGGVVHYKRKGTQCIRKYVSPVNPDTEEQRLCRSSFKDAVSSWQGLPDEEKDIYRKRIKNMKTGMTGFNLYISEYMKRNKKE